jgi:pyruvate dehydrogenase E1 component alpha subunit
MYRMRRFEEEVFEFYKKGMMPGLAHLYLGEEAIATGVCAAIGDDDYVGSSHRGHGHLVARGARIDMMMAEILGKQTGYSRGKGGSMHIMAMDRGILGANGIVGGEIPIATGAAYASVYRGTNSVAVSFFGDGATNRGTFHEAMNLASVWNLPVVFICENNHFGMSTAQEKHMKARRVADRTSAYGILGVTVDGNDPVAVKEATREAIARVKRGDGQTLVECVTWRHHGHFIGDPGIYKDPKEQELWLSAEKDPVLRFERRLLDESVAARDEIEEIKKWVNDEIDAAVRFAEQSPDPEPESMYDHVYTER